MLGYSKQVLQDFANELHPSIANDFLAAYADSAVDCNQNLQEACTTFFNLYMSVKDSEPKEAYSYLLKASNLKFSDWRIPYELGKYQWRIAGLKSDAI